MNSYIDSLRKLMPTGMLPRTNSGLHKSLRKQLLTHTKVDGDGRLVDVEGAIRTPDLVKKVEAFDNQGWHILEFQDAFHAAETPPWAIEDLVMANTVTLVSAHPHAMKSLSWLYACLEGVARQEVFGHFAALTLKSALFIETEDPEWLVKRRIQGFAKGLGFTQEDHVPGFHFTCPGPFGLINEIEQLERRIEKFNLDLIVISTLQNILEGKDWKEQKEMAGIMAELVATARLCPIVLLTHSPQDPRLKRAAGTITLGANCATHRPCKDCSRTEEALGKIQESEEEVMLEHNAGLRR